MFNNETGQGRTKNVARGEGGQEYGEKYSFFGNNPRRGDRGESRTSHNLENS